MKVQGFGGGLEPPIKKAFLKNFDKKEPVHKKLATVCRCEPPRVWPGGLQKGA